MIATKTYLHGFLMGALTAASIGLGGAQDASGPKVEVSPFSIREVRERHLGTGDLKPEHAPGSSLTVTLLLEGPGVVDATHYAPPEVSKAVDEQGNSLVMKSGGFGAGHFSELNREHMWFFEDEKPKDKIKIDLSLEVPPRGAKQIAELSGTVQMKQIVTKPHLIGNLATLAGKKIEDAALATAGVEVQIVKFQPDEPSEVLEFKLKDPKERVRSYELVDANGEKVSSGYGAFGFGGSTTVQLSGNESVPKTAQLKLELVSGEPKLFTVPFELSEPLALP